MTFNSLAFLIFLPSVLAGYFLTRALPERLGGNLRWVLLLLASYFFYMYTRPALVLLILLTTLVSYLAALWIERIDRCCEGASPDAKRRGEGKRRLCLILTLSVCLGVLFFFKYFNFFAESVLDLVGIFTRREYDFSLRLLLPVGISFYTFQTLSYVIDVYRRRIPAERHLGYYALFVSFFPQLVAGPIERPQNLLPQLKKRTAVSREDLSAGISKLALGFFKKIAVADLLGEYVGALYNHLDTIETVPTLGVVVATLLFAVQIYADFSGYTDIAIGSARIMGIRLMKNFDRPYTAGTVREFWGRWHLSLSSWFRDYLYIPLGGSRVGRARHLLNVAIVFLVSGLWHGAAATFVLWGALHAAYQIIGTLTLRGRDRLLSRIGLCPSRALVRSVRRVLTFLLVDFAWLFFRANSTGDLARLLFALISKKSLSVGLGESLRMLGLDGPSILLTVLSIVLLFFLDRLVPHHGEGDGGRRIISRGTLVTVAWIVIFAWTYLAANDMTSSFIYFQF